MYEVPASGVIPSVPNSRALTPAPALAKLIVPCPNALAVTPSNTSVARVHFMLAPYLIPSLFLLCLPSIELPP
jgi:hypothetical protein